MRILCTLDGSPEAEAALPVARRLAEAMGASLKLLMVVDGESQPPIEAEMITPIFAQGPATIFRTAASSAIRASQEDAHLEYQHQFDNLLGAAEQYLDLAAQPLRDAGIEVETEVEVNEDIDGKIVSTIVDEACDLVVMASHGRTGFGALVHGSIVQAVLNAGAAPVVLVPRAG